MTTKFLFACAAVIAAAPTSSAGAQQACSAPYYVEQRFPTTGTEETRWRLCWQVHDSTNLVITGAWFRPAPTAAWIKIIYDARVSQLFVPYHGGSPRYYDVNYGFGAVPLTSGDCPPPTGAILGPGSPTCKQVRDRGLAWKHDALKRRGEELVLWSVLAAANYNYIIEWTFRDDGMIIGRVGATGQVAGSTAHMHGPIWRLDLDLNGSCCNGANLFTHTEVSAAASDAHLPVVMEGGLSWNASTFPMLEIHDQTLKNSNSKQTSWDLMPTVAGIPSHLESFTKSTFWVTHYHYWEMFGNSLPTYVSPPEVVANSDIVVWYYAGLHHLVRDEDTGMTHLMWVGFALRPANLWGKTPLYP
jgi:Cu2+-containing amine oxidase